MARRRENTFWVATQELADRYRAIAEKLPNDAEEWHREMARQSYSDFRDLLSGTVSTRQLRKERQPYAKKQLSEKKKRGGSRVRRDPYPINKQTGRLRSGLFLKETLLIGLQSFEMGSVAPYAKYVLDPRGTELMIGRGVMTGKSFGLTANGEIERRWRVRQKLFIQKFRNKIRNPK